MQLSIYCSIASAIVDNFRHLVGTSGLEPQRKTAYVSSGTFSPMLSHLGGNKWTRTTDLTLIRRVL